MKPLLERFAGDDRGTFATTLGVMMSALVVAIAFGVNIAGVTFARSNLQEIVDGAVVAAAKEAQLSNFSVTVATGVARESINSNLTSRMHDPEVQVSLKNNGPSASSQFGNTEVLVAATVHVAHPIWSFNGNTVTVSATARAKLTSSGKLCVIVLEDKGSAALGLETSAQLSAPDCAVYSNSVSSDGLKTANHASLTSDFICTAGGFKGSLSSFSTPPLTDCPATPDPLAGRTPPSADGCLSSNTAVYIDHGDVTLDPGTYCNGMTIQGTATVKLKPGNYIFKNGPLAVEGSATFQGEYVGLYFVGSNATASFGPNTTIDIGAPKDGPLAGILIFQDRGASEATQFAFRSNNARNLLGTIYLPKAELLIDSSGPLADKSEYTAIVTRKMVLKSGPNLVLNTNYGATDVPVPAGIGEIPGQLSLTQ